MYVYSLTQLTGRRKNVDRTIVVATVEVNRATFLVVVLSALASVLPSLLVALLLGPFSAYALIVPVLCIGAGLFLVDQRTRKGLQLRRYEAMWDKRRAKTVSGTAFVCGQPMRAPHLVTIVQTVIPNPGYRPPPPIDLFDNTTPSPDPDPVLAASIPRDPQTLKGRFL